MIALQHISATPARMHFATLTAALEERYGANARELETGHWAFEVLTGDQRSQVVHFLLRETSAEGRDVSRIVVSSPIGVVPARFDAEALLRRNATLDVGAVCIEDLRGESGDTSAYLTLRGSHLVSTADFEEVWEMVEKVARVADALEKEIYARDLF